MIPLASTAFGVYIHWPFCLSKCPYCDFNSHVREQIDEMRWRHAILKDLDALYEQTSGRTVTSVFFGGGTPSLMSPATVAAVIEKIHDLWSVFTPLEITLEANPNSIEVGRFQGFKSAGINRVSVGIQALNDPDLQFLGRKHSAKEARDAIQIASQVFTRYSFDLIYSRPGQSLQAWDAELQEALSMAGDHLSLYQLTIEEGTAFHGRYQRGDFVLPDEDLAASLYELTNERLAGKGFENYEISNYARPGSECRHNLTYWRYQDYGGVGPGAHGRLTTPEGKKYSTYAYKAPESWLKAVEETGAGLDQRQEILASDRLTEMLMMGLRTAEGVQLQRLKEELGSESIFDQVIKPQVLSKLSQLGLLELTENTLRATSAGRQRLNGILRELV